jgi:predicted naringenin-chalcone synthase
MAFTVRGMGTALPAHAVTQEDAAELARQFCRPTETQARLLSILFRRSGVRTRHIAVLDEGKALPFFPSAAGDADRGPTTALRMRRYEAEVGPLAGRAARQALDRSGLSRRDLTHLVTVSCTGFAAPGLDVHLIKGLGLSPNVQRTHVGFMGCHGALNGLQVARNVTGADPEAHVLLCAAELSSVHLKYGWDQEHHVAQALFADGAAAVVGSAAGPAGAWRVTATGSCLFPDSEDGMTWHIGDHGFEMTLSARVPDLIGRHLRPWLDGWLGQNGLCRGGVGSWAVHPGGPRILRAVEQSLDLPGGALADSYEVLAECGNMSSPTVLFILDRLRARRAPRPCVALGFGPGLVVEAALFA